MIEVQVQNVTEQLQGKTRADQRLDSTSKACKESSTHWSLESHYLPVIGPEASCQSWDKQLHHWVDTSGQTECKDKQGVLVPQGRDGL